MDVYPGASVHGAIDEEASKQKIKERIGKPWHRPPLMVVGLWRLPA